MPGKESITVVPVLTRGLLPSSPKVQLWGLRLRVMDGLQCTPSPLKSHMQLCVPMSIFLRDLQLSSVLKDLLLH